MPVSDNLRDAYMWHKAQLIAHWRPIHRGSLKPVTTTLARAALDYARADVNQGKRRYPGPVKPYPAVGWSDTERGFAYVQSVDGAGLRFVGRVTVESYGGRSRWDKSGKTGWYTDPFAEGWNLCFGVVYQLPARNGKARFVAGYDFSEDEAGLTLDFSRVFESDSDSDYYPSNRFHGDGTKDAAYAADDLARAAAERERGYQTAWQAGQCWSDLGESIAANRKALLALLAERRQAKQDATRYPAICAALADKASAMLHNIREWQQERATFAAGSDEQLGFYTGDDTLKAAFNDGAGETVLA